MKNNRFTKLFTLGATCACALGTVLAQDTSTTSTTTAGAAGTSTTSTSISSMDGTGTITTLSPGGNVIAMRTTTTAQPTMFYYTPQTVIVDPDGNAVQVTALRADMPVSYTYTKDGDHMVITKVTLQHPISFYEKKTTTTTTTNPNP